MKFDQLQLTAVSVDENPKFPQYVQGSNISAQFFSEKELITIEDLDLNDFEVKHIIVHSLTTRAFAILPTGTSTLIIALYSNILWNGIITVKVNQSCLFDLAENNTMTVSKGITRFVTITPKNGWKILTSFFPWMRRRLVENIRYYTNRESSDKMDAFFKSSLGVADSRELILLDWLGHHFLGVMEQPKKGVK